MAEPPAELVSALRNLKGARARHDAGLERVHEAMRQARRDGASITDVAAWTGYSRRQVINITRHARDA